MVHVAGRWSMGVGLINPGSWHDPGPLPRIFFQFPIFLHLFIYVLYSILCSLFNPFCVLYSIFFSFLFSFVFYVFMLCFYVFINLFGHILFLCFALSIRWYYIQQSSQKYITQFKSSCLVEHIHIHGTSLLHTKLKCAIVFSSRFQNLFIQESTDFLLNCSYPLLWQKMVPHPFDPI